MRNSFTLSMNAKIYNLSKFRVILCSWNAKNFEHICPNSRKFRWKCSTFLITGVLTPYFERKLYLTRGLWFQRNFFLVIWIKVKYFNNYLFFWNMKMLNCFKSDFPYSILMKFVCIISSLISVNIIHSPYLVD